MKKKYFAPEIEEIKVEEPVLLDGLSEGSTGSTTGCPTYQCNGDGCPLEGVG